MTDEEREVVARVDELVHRAFMLGMFIGAVVTVMGAALTFALLGE